MSHPVVLALFDDSERASRAARAMRELGVPRERVSIVARSHEQEGAMAEATGASPGAEFEDSRPASRLGELGAHLLAAIALVLPGIGPIVADGPLAAELGEAAGHLAGGLARMLEHAGLPAAEAGAWQSHIEDGAFLIGVHTDHALVDRVRETIEGHGATRVAGGTWD